VIKADTKDFDARRHKMTQLEERGESLNMVFAASGKS
jgi:hypothetical protein